MNFRSVCSRFLSLALAAGAAMIVAPQWVRAQTFMAQAHSQLTLNMGTHPTLNGDPIGVGANPIVSANNEVGIGPRGALQTLHVHHNNAANVNSNGWQYGTTAYGSIMFDALGVNDLYLRVQDDYTQGSTHQSGLNGSGNGYNHANAMDLRAGKGFLVRPDLMFTPYLDYGHRYTNVNFEGTGDVTYRTHLAGLGLLSQYAPTQRLVLSADLAVDAIVDPLLDAPGGQHARMGTRTFEHISFGADYALTRTFHVFAEMDYSYGQFGGSDRANGFNADSALSTAGASVGVAYHY